MSLLEVGREVLRVEARTLEQLCDCLGPEFDAAVERLAACTGKVVFAPLHSKVQRVWLRVDGIVLLDFESRMGTPSGCL